MPSPLVSIVTASYNSASTIEDTIMSVRAQTYGNIEHIVIDGASTDGTAKILQAHRNDIAICLSEPDKGVYDAMNKGIARATGEIVGTLNADDFYASRDVVEIMVSEMERTRAEVCWGDLVYVARNNPEKIVRRWNSSPYQKGRFKWGWHPPHPTFFVRREVYDRYGAFDLGFKIAADYELMLRILERGEVRSCYIPKVMVKMRAGGMSNKSVRNIVRANREVYFAWKKNALPHGIRAALCKPLSKLIQLR